jgi:hypothetical protein
LIWHNEILRSGFVQIGLKDHSYGRFTWNTIDEHISVISGQDPSKILQHELPRPSIVKCMMDMHQHAELILASKITHMAASPGIPLTSIFP